MIKRGVQVAVVVALVLALAAIASADPDQLTKANTSQKGSLLVFPLVAEFEEYMVDVETLFFISNDNAAPTYVKCYWTDNNQTVDDFHFIMTANQPIVFSTRDNAYGPRFGTNRHGSLVCWAQNNSDTNQAIFNHLYGYAYVRNSGGEFYPGLGGVFYNAYAFAARGDNATAVPGKLPLDGQSGYDTCPKYLVSMFMPDLPDVDDGQYRYHPAITLWPCRQDLRQDRAPVCTKAKFDIWNWNEVKFGGAYQCFQCSFEGILGEIGDSTSDYGRWHNNRGKGASGKLFTLRTLGPFHSLPGLTNGFMNSVARLRVQGVKSSVCYGNTRVVSEAVTCTDDQHVATPLLGVVMYGWGYHRLVIFLPPLLCRLWATRCMVLEPIRRALFCTM